MTPTFSLSSFVAGFMLGLLSFGVWITSQDTTSDWMSTPALVHISPTATSTPESTESGAVSVNNQPPGTSVVVESVTVPPPGVWVAVREVTGQDLGNVLGAVRVAGPRTNVSVPLLRATEPNMSYALELYRDDNNDSFDLGSDSVYIDFATGAPVIAYFSTTN